MRTSLTSWITTKIEWGWKYISKYLKLYNIWKSFKYELIATPSSSTNAHWNYLFWIEWKIYG